MHWIERTYESQPRRTDANTLRKRPAAERCAQYASHAAEMKMAIPDLPTLFIKPSTSLADPWPAPTVLPKITQVDSTGDYESEMVIVIGRDAKDVREEEALDYVLGYTAANDVSSRTSQMNQSQWCFSKGFDTACPIGRPTYISLHWCIA